MNTYELQFRIKNPHRRLIVERKINDFLDAEFPHGDWVNHQHDGNFIVSFSSNYSQVMLQAGEIEEIIGLAGIVDADYEFISLILVTDEMIEGE